MTCIFDAPNSRGLFFRNNANKRIISQNSRHLQIPALAILGPMRALLLVGMGYFKRFFRDGKQMKIKGYTG
jgi:hypothetical protein